MPVFDAKHPEQDFEGQALLGALLYPSRAARIRALRAGQRRLERNPFLIEPMTMEPRLPLTGDDLAPVAAPQR
ncbi:hypothetical protein [Methylobacterium aerolatum]|uniref:Uncharacterized protein n=1 Tax=Methylobacterium aerolatum TaxID=418708 RepID=A0ABU0I4T7_9HYPH|nr:hypothetical protein [Methylobacterium aerolatum]MDQ0449097.1 hypothetical protein [Methylobacterium aerolatum]GJD35285.1 hypothetical protein FMGBMHLM_2194 [Methylobacterium aerolatum]